jgi:chemotaxis protein CheC
MGTIELSRIRLDAFKEITSIATGSAATSLSRMLGVRVDVSIPSIAIEALEKVPDLLGGPERTVTAVCFSLTGRITGTILLILSPTEALSLASALIQRPVDCIDNLDEMAVSALKELGNIVTGSYVRVFAQGLGVKTVYSVPGFAIDMLGAILDQTLAQMSLEANCAVILESEFLVRGKVHGGHLIFVVPLATVAIIIAALAEWDGSA